MYFKLYVTSLLSVALLASCSKDKVSSPDFKVSTKTTTVKVGDEVSFKFSGDPDNITFYSGMEGFRYDSIGKAVAQYGSPSLEFYSATRVGPGSIKLLMSSDLTDLSSQNIGSINWIDISDRANFAVIALLSSSGKIDLSDLVVPNKPVRFAFKFDGPSSSTTLPPVWTIGQFNLYTTFLSGNTTTLQTLGSLQWSVFDVKNQNAKWIVTTTLRIDAGARNEPDNEDWVVSNSIDLMAKIDAYEFGVPLKNITTKLTEYNYKYTKPGIYKATFVGANTTLNGSKELAKTLTITVTP
ncbi:hypothetical protein ADIARSV_2651 [Arcticibacter svalbardensis MN12-7]|uniref:DUF5017 domain-containing protein n=1 Tax=Arcticibacter svalbardensis MN12-7 TaxID=1150600 RepID=R9GR36_9SPHI|nr:DUF5017 domain-containing protein [Arcticibacter svalbardensis]EOR94156.1 hypothetical protein ADIARSV_2651 [Arcticibacter svalbardensis MN12-7]